MSRLIAIGIAGLLSLGLTVGDTTPGPIVAVVLPSGSKATFDTGVTVTSESRLFEGVWSVAVLEGSDAELRSVLESARQALDPLIIEAKADTVLLSILTNNMGVPSSFSCWYEPANSKPRCLRQ